MEWKQLSDEAKNVIEWLESPFTGAYKTLDIEVGSRFIMSQTDIMITQKLFDEIARYTTEDENICGSISHDNKRHIFKFTDEFKSKNRA